MGVQKHYYYQETLDFAFLEVSMRSIALSLLYGLLVYEIEVKLL